MNQDKRKRLEVSGWRVGTVEEFLKLSSVEKEIVEIRLALSQELKESRKNHNLSQKALAEQMESSQSKIAKREAVDQSVF